MERRECQGQRVLDFDSGFRKGQKTSRLADEATTASGLKETQCLRILAAIKKDCNGFTSQEIALKSGIPNEIVHKRLSALKDNGFLTSLACDRRKCNVTRRIAKTWWLA